MYSYNIVQSDPGNHFAHHLQIKHITIKCVKIPINIALHSLENTWHLFRWNILFTVIPAQSFENPACSMKLKTFQRDYLHTLHLMAPFFNYYYCALHEYLHRHNVHMPFNKFALVGLTWTPANNFSFKCTCIVSLYRIYIRSLQCIPQVLLKATDKSSHWNQRREANEQYYLTKNNKLLILKQLITSLW